MDTEIPLFDLEARTATTVSEDVRTTVSDRGALLLLSIEKAPAANETLTLQVEAKDEVSSKYLPITAFGASKKGEELGAGTILGFTVYPGALETAAVAAYEVQGLPIPRHWRVKVTHSAAGSWTYSVGYQPLS